MLDKEDQNLPSVRTVIKIIDSNVHIAPAATTQYVVIRQARAAADPERELTADELRLYDYVPDVLRLRHYTARLADCKTAHELAQVVGTMIDDQRIRRDTVVKASFIELLLPFALRLTSGRKIDNLRQHINNMLAGRGRGERGNVQN